MMNGSQTMRYNDVQIDFPPIQTLLLCFWRRGSQHNAAHASTFDRQILTMMGILNHRGALLSRLRTGVYLPGKWLLALRCLGGNVWSDGSQ
jgi:hypothetical protein